MDSDGIDDDPAAEDEDAGEEAFAASSDQLTAAFGATPAGIGLEWVANQVLHLKWAFLDPDITRWTPEDVSTLLLVLIPRKAVIDPADRPEFIRGFAAFLRWLGREGIIKARAAAERAAGQVEELAGTFADAMDDDSHWGTGKRLLGAAGEGVELTDRDQLDAWIQRFNERPLAERDAILGPSPAAVLGNALIGPLPPVVLAAESELRAAAEVTVWIDRVNRLVDFVGDGRPLTGTGNLKLADGRALVAILGTTDPLDEVIGNRTFRTRSSTELLEVDLTFALALQSNVLASTGRRVTPGGSLGLLAEDPLDAWYALLLVLLQRVGLCRHRYGGDRYGWGWFAEALDKGLPLLLLDLYRAQGPVELPELADTAWAQLVEQYDLDDVAADKLEFHRGLVSRALRYSLTRLAEYGAVALDDAARQPVKGDDLTGEVWLTDLGVWALQRFAGKVTSAPVVRRFANVPVEVLLTTAADLPDELARAEIDNWVDRHPDDSARRLAEALRTADDTVRGLAFRALLRIGPAAADALAGLGDDPQLRPYVTVWRVDAVLAGPEQHESPTSRSSCA